MTMKKISTVVISLLSGMIFAAGEYSADLQLNHSDGFYRSGEEVCCRILVLKNNQPLHGEKFRVITKFDGHQIARHDFEANGEPVIVTARPPRPGWLYFGVQMLDQNGKTRKGPEISRRTGKPSIVGEIGAVSDPERITPAGERPADFDDFWAACRDRLNTVPVKAKLSPVPPPAAFSGKVECFAAEIDCLGARPATGYLVLPVGAKPNSLPIHVDFQSGTWRDANLTAACRAAGKGMLAFYNNWRGLPCGYPQKYYRDNDRSYILSTDPGCAWAGDTDRETWIHHDVFYRALRILDYMKTRPEWNGQDLIVQGGSGGGIQAIVAAALDPDVSLAVISVPSFCDFDGFKAGRLSSTYCYRSGKRLARLMGDPRIQRTVSYHDGVHFAPRIKCETYVCTGFTDELCFPSSVYAFYNTIPAETKKFMTTNPRTGHYGETRNTGAEKRLAKFATKITVYETGLINRQ